MQVTTRFAPSPTGRVHIGNIRVAIFNWLFARHEGGRFLLRLEDTDRERSTPEAVEAVLDAMRWLDIEPDEEPVWQSRRRDAHREAAERLLAAGAAVRENKGGKGECIVFRMPDRDVSFDDEVKGTLTKRAGDVQDLVIVRSDGSPVFHLANVVDDLAMGVTHVIRGDDHVENTFRHVALYRALGAEPPRFAHLPMIVNHQGKPYSKRDGDAYVGEFREQGILPHALFNYLALLGWSPGDDRELMSREEMVERFALDRVQSSPARMDIAKLEWLNGRVMASLPRADYRAMARKELGAAGLLDGAADAYVDRVLSIMEDRIKKTTDFAPMTCYFFTDDYPEDEKAVRKRLLKEGALDHLAALRERLAALDPFDAESAERALHGLAEERGVNPGSLIHPARVAASGTAAGPGLFDLLDVLGRERVVKRFDRALARIGAGEREG
jgi:glutamyl-tRNA synthetase